MSNNASVKCCKMNIPTYCVGAEEKLPMFFEKRVYQGSSGKVYPNPVIEKISDKKTDKEYDAVILENDYIYVIILPELGGRIYTAYDKTNNYDFVYHNKVIKPALVGLLGPWISGGIEFNWPQHHRPSTFMAQNFKIAQNDDKSVSCFVGEIENMFCTKGMIEFRLYPDKSFIEINAQLYNRTDLVQTFLWWANPAVRVNDKTRTIMPPDVTAVMDHGKRAVSPFPIATGEYYKMDYSKGVDISMYKNIEVPTSFMASKSDFNFVGGYDYGINAGIYHFADHHVSPGKKQWTWGSGDFGQAWDRNLTDEDGPYVELMTGCFTDNQPDFTFIAPHEEKTFTQYFMPYKAVGQIKNANKDFCLNFDSGGLIIYSTSKTGGVKIVVEEKDKIIFEQTKDFNPGEVFEQKIKYSAHARVTLSYGCEVLTYSESDVVKHEIPLPATAIPPASEVKTTEELYLYGVHLEQYRHATRLPEDYYLEGLKRDGSDIRLNNAYGELLLRRGNFAQSVTYFERAINKLTIKNGNPSFTAPYYNFGIALLYLNKRKEAYGNFYKCVWSNDNKAAAFYYLAAISAAANDLNTAYKHINNALVYNSRDIKALNLKARICGKLLQNSEEKETLIKVREIDKMDILSDYTLAKLEKEKFSFGHINPSEIVETAIELFESGDFLKAIEIIDDYIAAKNSNYPLLSFYKAYAQAALGKDYKPSIAKASKDDGVCFAHRLYDIIVLSKILELDASNYTAHYYLGNLHYDKKSYEKAHGHWMSAEKLNPKDAAVKRNLALYYYNKKGDAQKAVHYLEEAFAADRMSSRILMELDQLYAITCKGSAKRFKLLEDNLKIISERDDLYIEYLTLLNAKNPAEVEKLLAQRNFHPWEGGEGRVTKLYKQNKIDLAKILTSSDKLDEAIVKLEEALSRPHNLGEGKLCLDNDNDVHYYLGLTYGKAGNGKKSKEHYLLAARGDNKIAEQLYYNDSPIEYIYYAALSFKALGNEAAANKIADDFSLYAEKHACDKIVIDYFAVSLPDMLIWEQDIIERNREFCKHLQNLSKTIKNS